ncbi:MAG: CRISPR-associated endonuclease Cas2 [Betaproteobacteria bacterium]|nr:CRISPR-associated endonuclease Cas2 [Betaproteobacteria bacterium]
MDRPTWYLLAYDITCPRRLYRVHRHLRKHATPVQKSVHFVSTTERGLDRLLKELDEFMHKRHDDLRVWPISHPGDLWYAGNFVMDGRLVVAGEAPQAPGGSRVLAALKNLIPFRKPDHAR